jgi:cell division protease FtsH
MALYNVFQTSSETRGVSEVSYTTLISEVSGGNVRDVEISGDEITGTFNDGSKISFLLT